MRVIKGMNAVQSLLAFFSNTSHKTKYNLKVDLPVDIVGSQVMEEPEINYGMN
jgi:hypothetical protein